MPVRVSTNPSEKEQPMQVQAKEAQVQPYLFFDGRCEEAIEFYKRALGAEVTMLMRVKECPEPHAPGTLPPGSENKVMHAAFRIGGSTLLASDGRCLGRPTFAGFSLSLSAADEAEAERWFAALAKGGKTDQPLSKTFFSPSFGMLTDRFGVQWMIVVASSDSQK
jgi:PhnB protein